MEVGRGDVKLWMKRIVSTRETESGDVACILLIPETRYQPHLCLSSEQAQPCPHLLDEAHLVPSPALTLIRGGVRRILLFLFLLVVKLQVIAVMYLVVGECHTVFKDRVPLAKHKLLGRYPKPQRKHLLPFRVEAVRS